MGGDNWTTPREMFAKWWGEHHFTIDAAASAENALVRPHDNKACTYIGPWDGTTWRLPQPGEYCPRCDTYVGRFYTKADDGRNQCYAGERVFCNPPYTQGQAAAWVEKACTSANEEGATWLLVLPPSIDTKWFHRFIWDSDLCRPRYRATVNFPPGRIHFGDPDSKGRAHPPTGNLIVTFRP